MKHVWRLQPGSEQHSAGSWCSRRSSVVVEGTEGRKQMERIEVEQMIAVVVGVVVVEGEHLLKGIDN